MENKSIIDDVKKTSNYSLKAGLLLMHLDMQYFRRSKIGIQSVDVSVSLPYYDGKLVDHMQQLLVSRVYFFHTIQVDIHESGMAITPKNS